MLRNIFSYIFIGFFLILNILSTPLFASSDDDDMPTLAPIRITTSTTPPLVQEEADDNTPANALIVAPPPMILHNSCAGFSMLHPHIQMILLHPEPGVLMEAHRPENTILVPYVSPTLLERTLLDNTHSLPALFVGNTIDNEEDQEPSISNHPINARMPFKLGFEFQEGNGLCEWALKDFNIQKKPLFQFISAATGALLWHVVIDTNDIEFVTIPFTDIELLTEALETIKKSLLFLQKTLEAEGATTFEKWGAFIQETVGHLIFVDQFDLVKDKNITKPLKDEWHMGFNPQFTIQHPLEYTIPLYFSLFGFKDHTLIMPFVESLPFHDTFLKACESGDFSALSKTKEAWKEKLSGLAFLHAFTMARMTPAEGTKDDDLSDAQFLKETLEGIENFYQADAKMNLTIMSRRPFSSMLQKIYDKQGRKGPAYTAFFIEAVMKRNDQFSNFCNIPRLFCKANYADQYFDEETGQVKPLLPLLAHLNEKFIDENSLVLIKLLKKGVISTAMIRNLSMDKMPEEFRELIYSPEAYVWRVIDSVENPKERYELEDDTFNIIKKETVHDLLSPPEFLDKDDSMGNFKEEAEEYIDESYGEAIVEIRGASRIGPWFLEKVGLEDSVEGDFLTIPSAILVHARKLFEFLDNFGRMQHYMDNIWAGMTHSIYKY